MRYSRTVASVLALLFGITGIHRFYLGDNTTGGAFVAGLITCMILLVTGMASWSFAMLGFIAVADAINLMTMSDQGFDHRFNDKHHVFN